MKTIKKTYHNIRIQKITYPSTSSNGYFTWCYFINLIPKALDWHLEFLRLSQRQADWCLYLQAHISSNSPAVHHTQRLCSVFSWPLHAHLRLPWFNSWNKLSIEHHTQSPWPLPSKCTLQFPSPRCPKLAYKTCYWEIFFQQ